jgi:hypothetical protein
MMVAENAPGISQVMMHAFGIAPNDGRLIVDHLFEGAVHRVDRARQARLRHDRKTRLACALVKIASVATSTSVVLAPGTPLIAGSSICGVNRSGRPQPPTAAALFVLGFATVFVALGASASAIGAVLRAYSNQLAIIAGLGIMAMGMYRSSTYRTECARQDDRLGFW